MSPIQPVSVAGIEFDALIDSEEAHEADVPQYPTEKGFSVADNVSVNAMELSMTLYLTATPITWRSTHGTGEDRLLSIPEKLITLYKQREPISVYTQDKTYTNMVIKSISIKRDADTGVAREIPVTFQQIDVTESETVTIPSTLPHSGTTKSSSGSSGTSSASSSDDSSSSSDSSDGSSGASNAVSNYVNAIKNYASGDASIIYTILN